MCDQHYLPQGEACSSQKKPDMDSPITLVGGGSFALTASPLSWTARLPALVPVKITSVASARPDEKGRAKRTRD